MKKLNEEIASKQRKTQERGITLIALVIAIVVLLILAGVSIAMLTGQNGILTQATKAREENRGASVQEQIDLWRTNQTSDELAGINTAISKTELLDSLENEKLLIGDERTKLENGEAITIGSKTISLAKTLVKALIDGDIEVGTYVNYTPENTNAVASVGKEETGYNETQNYAVDTNTTWRVLGLSEDGKHVMLTSGSPIKKTGTDPYLVLQGAEGYYNSVDTLKKISNIYHNSKLAEETRSMTIEDINNALGITLDKTNNKIYKTADSTQTALPYQGFFGQSYNYKNGDYAPENYLKKTYTSNTKYEGLTSKKIGDTVNGTAYAYPITESSIVEQNGTLYNMLFKGTLESDNNAKSYWLASPGVFIDSDVAGFGPGVVYCGRVSSGDYFFGSNGRWFARGFAVRPVVSLKSNITVDDIKVVTGKTEETWSRTGEIGYGSRRLSGATGMVDGSTGK